MHTRRLLLSFLLLGCACCGARSTAAESAAQNPFAVHALPAASRTWTEGDVVERLAAGPYVYLQLREPSGRSSWLVSLRATTPSSSRVRALVVGRAAHFRSRRLDREFSPLSFAAVRSAAP